MNARKMAAGILCLWLMLFLGSALGAGERVFDQAGLFTPEQEKDLNAAIALFQQETGMDFVVVTSLKDLGPRDESYQAAADDFYDQGDFGFGEEYSGALYYVNMEARYQHLNTTGDMIDYMTDRRISAAIDAVTRDLSAGRYAAAAEGIISRVQGYVQAGIPEGQYRYSVEEGRRVSGYHKALTLNEILLSAVAAVVVGFLAIKAVESRYKLKGSTYRYQYNANADVTMTDTDDTFLRTRTTTTRKPPPSSSSGGGSSGGRSSVHRSSSGRSHGGGGGRF